MTTYVSTALICSNGTILNAPSGDGTSRQVVATNASGQLSFITLTTSDISNFPTLGSAAYVNTTTFCQVVNNLSDVNATAAKTNLGLATVASTGVYSDLISKPDLTVYAPLASPALTGNPTSPNQTAGDSSTKIANTNFVTSAINTVLAAAPNKNSVKYATTAALPANTYNNGSSGIGATITANSNGAVTVDGSALALNDQLLVHNEVTTANNGIYSVTQAGDSTHPLILTRRTDFDQTTEVSAGDAVYVTSGSTLAGTTWQMNTVGTITIGSSAINWTQSAGPGSYLAGTGMTLTGTTFSVNASQTQITAIGTVTTGTWNATAINSTYIVTGTSGASIPLLNGNNTHSGALTFSAAGGASAPGVHVTGKSFAGNGTTSFPQLYVNDLTNATPSTTLNTAGTAIGANVHGTPDLLNLMTDGISKIKSDYAGNLVTNAVYVGGVSSVIGLYYSGGTLLLSGIGGVTTSGAKLDSGYFLLDSSRRFGWTATTYVTGAAETVFCRKGPQNIQFGDFDGASPVAQKLSFQSVAAGNANTAAVTTTVIGSLSNGSGGGGDIVFQTTASVASSGVQNSPVTVMTLKGGTQAVQLNDASHIIVGTSTGTKFGTATTQKISFYNATPIVQPSGDLATGLESLGLMATSSTLATTRLSGALPVRETTVADATSFTPNVGTTDLCYQSNSQAGGTLTINNPTGSPVDGQTLLIRLKCTNAQTLSWGTNYVTSTDLALPTTTSSGGKYDYVLFIYNGISSKYDILDKNFGH